MRVGSNKASPTVWPSSGVKSETFAGLDRSAVDDVLALDHADAEAGHVVIAGLIEVRQDGRLAPHQGAFRFHAAVADPRDQGPGQGRVVPGHGEVIEEQERLAAGAETVIDRHGDQVDAHRIVLVHQAGHLELTADAVGAGNEDRVTVVLGKQPAVVIEAEETGEAAEAVQDTRRVRAFEQGRHAGQALLVELEVEAGVAVS
jgi:hypothetical protein